ncbi:hypothetical protein L3Q72_06570 [Vibrio sp. JC009]|uniref:hypothetical protein n=1 Tax=Vibrio sp. JC009 TaxID=2912314 RepID=UPI0023B18A89|nr:hypothetical protein [Vibrio sp. JC009]WED23053.1 hypothetical protein L3Q72_06570 [Vibrio sp. JC009]
MKKLNLWDLTSLLRAIHGYYENREAFMEYVRGLEINDPIRIQFEEAEEEMVSLIKSIEFYIEPVQEDIAALALNSVNNLREQIEIRTCGGN